MHQEKANNTLRRDWKLFLAATVGSNASSASTRWHWLWEALDSLAGKQACHPLDRHESRNVLLHRAYMQCAEGCPATPHDVSALATLEARVGARLVSTLERCSLEYSRVASVCTEAPKRSTKLSYATLIVRLLGHGAYNETKSWEHDLSVAQGCEVINHAASRAVQSRLGPKNQPPHRSRRSDTPTNPMHSFLRRPIIEISETRPGPC